MASQRVLATIPGYGGKSVCEVVGEDTKRYALRAQVTRTKLPPERWDDWSAMTDPANSETTWRYFSRRKTQCIPLFNQETT